MIDLVLCEESQTVTKALRAVGREAYSVDILPTRGDPRWHFEGDVFDALRFVRKEGYKVRQIIAHPVCTYMANSGVRWLYHDGLRYEPRWADLHEGCEFYKRLRYESLALTDRVAIENPIWHGYAAANVGNPERQFVQPWMFGHPSFKATGWEIYGMPKLVETESSLRAVIPKKGTTEYKKWSAVHREPPGAMRQRNRSKTPEHMAAAYAAQWGAP